MVTLSEIYSRHSWNYYIYSLIECFGDRFEVVAQSDDLDYIRTIRSDFERSKPLGVFIIQQVHSVARIVK